MAVQDVEADAQQPEAHVRLGGVLVELLQRLQQTSKMLPGGGQD